MGFFLKITMQTADVLSIIAILVSLCVAVYTAIHNGILQRKMLNYQKRYDDFKKANKILNEEFAPLIVRILKNKRNKSNDYIIFRGICTNFRNSIAYLDSINRLFYDYLIKTIIDIDFNYSSLCQTQTSKDFPEKVAQIKNEIDNLFKNMVKEVNNYLKTGKYYE